MKNKLFIFLLTITALMIIGCDKDEDPAVNPLLGTWNLTGVEITNDEVTEEECEAADTEDGVETAFANGECVITYTDLSIYIGDDVTVSYAFNDDYAFTLSVTDADGSAVSQTGTWSASGTTLTLISDDEENDDLVGTYSISGNTLRVTDNDMTMIFTKQ